MKSHPLVLGLVERRKVSRVYTLLTLVAMFVTILYAAACLLVRNKGATLKKPSKQSKQAQASMDASVSLALGPAFAVQKENRAQLLKYKNKRDAAEAKRLTAAAARHVTHKSLPDSEWAPKVKLMHLQDFIDHVRESSEWAEAQSASESSDEDCRKKKKVKRAWSRRKLSRTIRTGSLTKAVCIEWIEKYSSLKAARSFVEPLEEKEMDSAVETDRYMEMWRRWYVAWTLQALRHAAETRQPFVLTTKALTAAHLIMDEQVVVKPQDEVDHCPDNHWHVYGAATAAQRKRLKMPPGPQFSYLPTAAPDLCRKQTISKRECDRKTTTTVPIVTGTLIDKMEGYRHCRCWVGAEVDKFQEAATLQDEEGDKHDVNKDKKEEGKRDKEDKESADDVNAGKILRFVHKKWRLKGESGTDLFPNFDAWKRRQVEQTFEALPVDIKQRWFMRYKQPSSSSSSPSSPSFYESVFGTRKVYGIDIDSNFEGFYLRGFIVEEVLSGIFNAPTNVSPASIINSYLVPIFMDCITSDLKAF